MKLDVMRHNKIMATGLPIAAVQQGPSNEVQCTNTDKCLGEWRQGG